MLKALLKSLLLALLMTLSVCLAVRAEVKQYQYDGKLPFVQMMLNMMTAMGMLDRVPVTGLYGSPVYPGSNLSNYNNPYARALALRGISPSLYSSYLRNPYGFNSGTQNLYGGYPNTGYGTNPFLTSPWLQSPWSQSAVNGASPLWGSPSWGVLPMESYPLYNNGGYGSSWGYPNWSANDLSGWVNEPWETSTWNPKAEDTSQSAASSTQPAQDVNAQSARNYSSGGVQQPQAQRNDRYNPSSLSKLVPPNYRDDQYPPDQYSYDQYPPDQQMSGPNTRPPDRSSAVPSQRSSRSRPDVVLPQKPCVTDFCGLKKPDLNGFWVAQNGEMLGIKNKQFLWSDGVSRYLSGLIKIENEYLLAAVEGHDQVMRFKYKLAGDHLLTLQPDGVIREFVRMSAGQYYDQYPYEQYQYNQYQYDQYPGYQQNYLTDYYQ